MVESKVFGDFKVKEIQKKIIRLKMTEWSLHS